MKITVRLAALAALAVLAACCGKKLDKATYEEYLMVPMMESARDSLDIQISLEYPTGGVEDSVRIKMIENLLFAAFDVNYNLPTVDSAAVHYRNDLIEEYQIEQEEYAKFIVDDNKVMEGNLFNWREYVNGYFTGDLTLIPGLDPDGSLLKRWKESGAFFASYFASIENEIGMDHTFWQQELS